MSHFVTVVLVPLSGKPEDAAIGLLETYDENIHVEPYRQQCYCVGRAAEAAARAHAQPIAKMAAGSDIKELRKSYWVLAEGDRPSWNEHISVYEKAKAEAMDGFLAGRDDRDSPDADCDLCCGTGAETVTHNPNGKWDWFRVGGRWDGWIQGTFRESEDSGFNFGNNCVSAEVYLQSVQSDASFVPFAIVTPDGEWYEMAKMGWFGMTRDEKDGQGWRDEVVSLLEANLGTVAVACDMHT